MLRVFIFSLTLIFSYTVKAQTGPVITCVDCEGLTEKSMPYAGSWYNPQQSGSGYLFDIQNGFLLGNNFGYYFGYDSKSVDVK